MRKRILAVLAVFVSVPMIAAAHGSMETPISRVYNCFKENPESPDSAACQAVVNMSGTQPLYDWNEVNQANAAGNHQAVIPDGTLCGGGRDKYAGLNLARTDWVATNVSSGQTLNMTFHATAPHATQAWTFYITRQGYDLTQPLRWADLEPLCTIGNIPVNNFRYNMSCQLPTSRSGRAIIYNTWQRSDSPEAFYTCIDVSFGGAAVPTPTPTPTAPPNATPTPTPTTPTQPGVVDITPSASGVTANTNDGNVPGNTVDNSLSTRWSGNGDGAWIQYDLGAMYTVSHVNIAVYNGATRRNRFDLQVSSGNGVWTNVLTNFETTGTSTQLETYNFGDVDARFVRYMGHMSNVGTFNSITEFEIWGSAITGPTATPTTPPAATPTPTATPTTPPSSTPTPTPTLPPSSAVEITPPGSAVTASTSDTNVASNTVDNNLGTRWSGNGDGATIQYDLGSTHTISYVKIAVYNGNGRRNRFDLQVSSGNGVWTNVVTNKETSGTTTQLETHDFGDVDARLIRYVGHMSNIGTFNSLTEVEVWGTPLSGPQPTATPTPTTGPGPTATPTPTPTTPPSVTPTPTPTNPPSGGTKILGYFAQWGVYQRGYHVKNIATSGSASKLTHINYAFGNVVGGSCIIGDSYADYERAYTAAESVDGVADTWDQPLRGSFNQLRKLKAAYPNIKVLFSFGGWTWSGGFGQAAQNASAFANSCYNVVEDPRWADVFDGIDIDWEYPNACGLSCDSTGPNSYVTLMQALRNRFGSSYLVTAAVPAGYAHINAANYGAAAQYLNWYNVMTYDFFGAFAAQGPTAMHSPLYTWPQIPTPNFYSDYAIQLYKSKGVPASKLLIGYGFYGRGWSGVTQSTPGGSASGPAPGTYEQGIEDYKVLVGRCPSNGTAAGTAYAYCGGQWWSYDTPSTINGKNAYKKSEGLGGAFFWELSGDTANGTLISAMYNTR